MVVVWIARVGGRGVKIGRGKSSLRVRCACRRKERAILGAKAIKLHAHSECLVSFNRVIRSIELKSILWGVYVPSDVIPFFKEFPRAQTT